MIMSCTYKLCGQLSGFSIRYPFFSNCSNSAPPTIPGYGTAPRVTISHSRTPKDHLSQQVKTSNQLRKERIMRFTERLWQEKMWKRESD